LSRCNEDSALPCQGDAGKHCGHINCWPAPVQIADESKRPDGVTAWQYGAKVATNPPARARITLPRWLWGGNPAGLLTESEYRSRPADDGAFYVQTIESYRQQRPDLVRLRTILEPGLGSPRWEDLAHLKERVEIETPRQLAPALERRRLRAEEAGALLDVINHQLLLLYAMPTKDLPVQARYFVEFLNSVRFTEDPERGPFPNAGVHVVEVNPALIHRLKIASVWLRIEQDVRLGSGDAAHIKALSTNDEQAFESSSGLYSGVMMFDAYLSPLLAAGTPGIWAVSVIRSFGSLIFDLGTFISGTDADATEMLHLISTPGANEVTHFPSLSAPAADGAIRWWAERLNLLFGVLSDLSTFTDTSGDYRPAKHLEAMLTIEQIFRRTTSLLVAHRDTNARRALMFTVLDSLEGVRGANFLTMCKLSHAVKVLSELESALPAPAAELLLPAGRRAVKALQSMQDGFFIRRQLGTQAVELQLDGSSVRSLSPEDATARYLKVLRDATHGHGSDRESTKVITDALLAHHDGDIPHDVGLLGYLYLLDVLLHPERVRQRLFRSGR
jgi:hypothetical protein